VLAAEIDDPWIGTLAASAAAQVAGQSGHYADSLVWLDRARRSAEGFDVSEEQVQQDWTRGVALLGLGRLDEAERVFEDVTRTGELTQQGVEYASLGWFGLAEVARARRDLARAIAGYERSLAGFPSGDQRATPWYLMLLATLVTASVADDLLPAADLARWATRLRTRTLALHRMNPTYVDRPVIGTALAGWSSWAMTVPAERDRGLRGLALAEALGARQDLPSLSLGSLFAQAREVVGADAVEAARAAASALPSEQLVEEALRVLIRHLPRR
jgi:tetratricopeptide (TPR) repeat protein